MIGQIANSPSGAVISFRAQPKSSKTGFTLDDAGNLKLRIRSAPVEGKANKEIVETLSKIFGIAKSRVEMVSGDTSKQKRFLLTGIEADVVEGILRKELGL